MGIQTIALALGLVLIFEGLVFVLAPRRIEDMLRLLASMPVEARRITGLVALVAGGILITLSQMMN